MASLGRNESIVNLSEEKSFVVAIVSPPGYVHSAVFREVALSLSTGLKALGKTSEIVALVAPMEDGRHWIILGAHLLGSLPPLDLPTKRTIYNFEAHGTEMWNQMLPHAKAASTLSTGSVWDFSQQNVLELGKLGILATFVPPGYVPELECIPMAPKDIDVLFYGSINDRRRKLLNLLRVEGLVVHESLSYEERDTFIARAKVVLNMHYYEVPGLFESVRVSYLLANAACVVSETGVGQEGYDQCAVCVPYDKLVATCVRYAKSAELSRGTGALGHERFKSQFDEAEILRRVLETKQRVIDLEEQHFKEIKTVKAQRTVVTAVFGGYERGKEPPAGFDRALMVTDGEGDPRWEVLRREGHGLSASRAFFIYKLTPHITVSDNDDVLWIDASFEPTGRDVRELFDLVPPGGVGIHRHRFRHCYYTEAEVSRDVFAGRDASDPSRARGALVMEQADYYKAHGCPLNGGLWETDIIVWRGAQRHIGERWLAEMMSWSASDQVSLPYVLHVTGTKVADLPGDVLHNPWFTYVHHGEHGRTTRKLRSEPGCGVGLCMIVKNEAHVIERCLRSVLPILSHWTVVDTGSTDGTQEIVRRVLADIPGELYERPWRDFAHNRNEAIAFAAGKTSHVLVIDADDALELAPDFILPPLTEDAYLVTVAHGGSVHHRAHVFRPDGHKYVGVLHEYLSPATPDRRIVGMTIRIHGGGARSSGDATEKFVNDAKTLKRALEFEPKNDRYVFYLAQSWRDAYRESGNKDYLARSLKTYLRRAEMGGFDEEIYLSLFESARCRELLGHSVDAIQAAYLVAYENRSRRAEPLFYLARWLRMAHSRYAMAAMYARYAAAIPKPTGEILFVEHAIYDWWALDEFAVAASYLPEFKAEARVANEKLLTVAPASEHARIRVNLATCV